MTNCESLHVYRRNWCGSDCCWLFVHVVQRLPRFCLFWNLKFPEFSREPLALLAKSAWKSGMNTHTNIYWTLVCTDLRCQVSHSRCFTVAWVQSEPPRRSHLTPSIASFSYFLLMSNSKNTAFPEWGKPGYLEGIWYQPFFLPARG